MGDEAPVVGSAGRSSHLIATGLTGAPTAPVTGMGAAVKKKSKIPSEAQSAASLSRSHISPMKSPMCGITTWCSGWKAFSNSLGRTSKPHVSVAIAAISRSWSQSGGVPAGVAAPSLATDPGQLPGPDEHDVATPDDGRFPLRGDGVLQVLDGDRVAVGQLPVSPERATHVEQHAAPSDAVGHGLDARQKIALA